jgi:hypothetical protein
VGTLVGIGHGVGHDRQFVASLVRRPAVDSTPMLVEMPPRTIPVDLAPAQLKVELGAVERAPAVLGDQDVAVAEAQLGAS